MTHLRTLARRLPTELPAALLAMVVLAACGQRLAGGDATETGNARVSGTVLDENGAKVGGAVVEILPDDFDPVAGADVPDSLRDTTDEKGRYRFARLSKGTYNVHARDGRTRSRLAVWGLHLGDASIRVPDDTLHHPGSLSVPVPETRDSGIGWIYIPGTTLRVRLDSELRLSGRVTLDSVPAGTVPRLEYAQSADAPPLELAANVEVKKDSVTRVDAFAAWPLSRKLILNTASGAASLAKDIRDFPLLVRLRAADFDFSRAAAGGSDLRFSSADGAPLPREIESWDSAAGEAAIWVRLDTLHAGRDGQYITMHWGAAPAAGPLRPRPVFDTLAGFAAVWHLGEEASDTGAAGIYKDATGAGSDGDDHVANTSRAGVIGAGHGLDSGDYIYAPHASPGLSLPNGFTLSVWFRANMKKLGSISGELLSVGDNYGMRVYDDSQLHMWYWPPDPPAGFSTDWYYFSAKVPDLLDGNWHLGMAVFDGSSLRLYCDGKDLGSQAAPGSAAMDFPLTVTLGKHGNGKRGYEYSGLLDEAEVQSVIRDADWARMTYENQKPDSDFPAFGP